MADLDSGSGIYLTRDPESGMEKFGSGINIPDPQHCYYAIQNKHAGFIHVQMRGSNTNM
jgi:hypothetical protein